MKNLIFVIIIAIAGNCVLAQAPVINSFSPASGPIGTTVTITGNNFSATAANNLVYFGAVKATVITAGATSLTVKVPLGATYQPLSVAVNNLIAYAQKPFIVTYSGGGMDFTSTSFVPALTLPGSGFGTAADLNGDNKTDLIYTDFTFNTIYVLKNTTAGGPITFAAPDGLGGCINPMGIKTADLNGDGLLDIIAASPTQNLLYIYKNSSTPGFLLFNSPISMGTGTEPRKIAIGDIDNDGKADIVCTNAGAHNVSVFKNTSTGGNISFNAKVDFATATIPEGVAIGDLTGDGKPDVAVATGGGFNAVSILVNTSTVGNISFDPKTDITLSSPNDIAMGDLDADGKADLVVSNRFSDGISVLRNTSTSSLSFAGSVTITTAHPAGLALNDLNADGKPDIISANPVSNNQLTVFKNNSTTGTMTFSPFVAYAADTVATTVVAADFNNDGLADIAIFNATPGGSTSVLKNQLNINTLMPQCPPLLTPANGAININGGIPQLFTWRKEPNATGYRIKIIEQSGAYTQDEITDTFYVFPPTAGINYTWNVTPINMADQSITCPGFSFSTCPATANPVTITETAGTDICGTDSVRIIASSGTNVQWFFNNKLIPGATANFIYAKAEGNYTLRVLNGTCYSNPSNTVVVHVLPTPIKPVITPNNDTAICAGGSITLFSSLNINNQWFNSSTPVAGANGNSFIASQAGNYYLRFKNTSSGCYNFSDTVAVLINPLPAAPTISVTGNTTICPGDVVTLSSSVATAFPYTNQWLKDGTVIGGPTGQNYNPVFSGNYTVKCINTVSTCISPASAPVAITINSTPPTPTLDVSVLPNICTGDSLKLHSSASSGNRWYKDGNNITGATGQDYFAKDAGTFSVKVIQASCTSAASNAIITTILPLPVKPVVTSNGTNVSTTAGYTGYQWYLNNNIIPGATAALYNTTQNGVYKVEVTGANGCKNVSDNFNYVTTATNDVSLPGYAIELFPNPVTDQLTIKVAQGITGSGQVTAIIADATGKPIRTKTLKIGTNTISLKNIAPGTYWVLLKNSRSEKAVKILKIN